MPKFVIEREIRSSKSIRRRIAGSFPRVTECFEGDGSRDSVAPQLRNGRQTLLRLPCSGRIHHPGTRQARGHSRNRVSAVRRLIDP